jgi:hypothetical protein
MTKEDIIKLFKWRDEDQNEANMECFLPSFDQTANLHIMVNNAGKISERTVTIVNDFIGLSQQHLATIKNYLWEDCQFYCDGLSYGFDVPEGMTETEANHATFGVYNGEDAYRKSNLSLSIIEVNEDEYTSNFGCLLFDNEWNGHLTTVVMRNGDVVGYGESGIYLGKFEK